VRVPLVDRALLTLDDVTVARVRPVLEWMRSSGPTGQSDAQGHGDPNVDALRRFLWHDLPARWPGGGREQHEVAWALGDLFQHAGLAEQASLCRSPETHEILAVWRWTRSFPDVPAEFWQPALSGLGPRPDPPHRVGMSLVSARALLEAVGDGLELTGAGRLPASTASALDDRFRWTEEFPGLRPAGERELPPLRFLHEHLTAQRLLMQDGRRLSVTEAGRAALRDTARLWRAVVDPAPRWPLEFDQDTLAVMAASLLRTGVFTPGRMTEEITHVLAAKWRPARRDWRGGVFDGASLVVQEWYQLGVPLGWWDTGRGPADRHPNGFGRAAAAAVFRSVARRPGRGAARG
jgi:hypothetical protein